MDLGKRASSSLAHVSETNLMASSVFGWKKLLFRVYFFPDFIIIIKVSDSVAPGWWRMKEALSHSLSLDCFPWIAWSSLFPSEHDLLLNVPVTCVDPFSKVGSRRRHFVCLPLMWAPQLCAGRGWANPSWALASMLLVGRLLTTSPCWARLWKYYSLLRSIKGMSTDVEGALLRLLPCSWFAASWLAMPTRFPCSGRGRGAFQVVRGRGRGGGIGRGFGGRGGRGGGRGRGRTQQSAEKSAEDLDKELESYHADAMNTSWDR